VIKPPVTALLVGQASVTAMFGAVVTGQVGETLDVAVLDVQMSLPVPLKVVVTEQALGGTVTLLVKVRIAPGASEATENTGVLGTGRSLTTTTLVNVMSPMFCTVPL
jgi:hypothetical protein